MIRISGIHAITAELAHSAEHIARVLVSYKVKNSRITNLVAEISAYPHIALEYVSHGELTSLLGDDKHQGIIAEISPKQIGTEADLKSHLVDTQNDENSTILVLDNITDTRNLGACLRSAKAFGVSCVILPNANSASINHTTYKASAGALTSLPIFIVANLARGLSLLQDAKYWVVGLDGYAQTDIRSYDFTGPHALVMGSEGSGLRALTKKHCDTLVYIPMNGDMESLNISVAAGVALFSATA